jgi:hypothetical protein
MIGKDYETHQSDDENENGGENEDDAANDGEDMGDDDDDDDGNDDEDDDEDDEDGEDGDAVDNAATGSDGSANLDAKKSVKTDVLKTEPELNVVANINSETADTAAASESAKK